MNERLIYLIGMMGSGKSTIGRILAREPKYHFIDTDVLIEEVAGTIENVAGRPIREILAHKGEEYFRDLETRVVRKVLMNYLFDDTDDLIEQNTRKSIKEIFDNEGEDYFRDLETRVLKELSAYRSSAIVATGGGIVQKKINWNYLRQGLVIWLDVDIEILEQRILGDENRPLADNLEPLLEKRHSLYSLADIQIECIEEQTPQQVADRIREQIPGMIMNK